MDSQTQLLISSLIINVLLIIERFLKRIRTSKCCGSEIILDKSPSSTDVKYEPPVLQPTSIELRTV
jgi:hypothetical protein